jgi:cohesin loading factor subunit SCC2
MFDDTARTPLSELIYVADNLAYFPYQQQDEPLFIMHQLDIIVSVSGSNLMQSFKELFYPNIIEADNPVLDPVMTQTDPGADPSGNVSGIDPVSAPDGTDPGVSTMWTLPRPQQQQQRHDEDDDEDVDKLLALLPDDSLVALHELYLTAQGCVLLLVLKQHLKDTYGFTDSKIQRYSPSDSAKTFEKPLNRKNGIRFHPKQALDIVQSGSEPPECTDDSKRQLINAYLDFKQLMLSIDPDDPDDEDTAGGNIPNGNVLTTLSASSSRPSILLDPETGLLAGPAAECDGATPQRNQPLGNFVTPSSTTHRHRHHTSLATGERRRGRPPGGSSSGGIPSSSASRPRPPKVKAKKRKKQRYGSESDSDDCAVDPDWS